MSKADTLNFDDERREALLLKARDCLYQTLDRLGNDKTHPLNEQLRERLAALETELEDGPAYSSGKCPAHPSGKY